MANVVEVVLKLKDKASSKLGKVLGGLKKRFAALGTAIKVGALAALAAFTAAMYKSIQAAGIQEVIIAKLQKAVENAGQSWAEANPQLTAFAAEMQKLTKYGDTQTYQLIQELIPYTGDYAKAMEGAKIAMDMAAAGLFDVRTASKYVGMAMQGNVEMLGRYIGELRTSSNAQLKHMSASEKTTYALELMRQKFGGMAEKELNTFSGRMSQLKNYVGDVMEAIGDGLTPTLTKMAEKISSQLPEIEKEFKRLSTIASETITAIFSIGKGNPFAGVTKGIRMLASWITRIGQGFLGLKLVFQGVVTWWELQVKVMLNGLLMLVKGIDKITFGKIIPDSAIARLENYANISGEFHKENVKGLNETLDKYGHLKKAQEDIASGKEREIETTKELTKAEQEAAEAAAKRLKAEKEAQEKAAEGKKKQLEDDKEFAEDKAKLLEQLQDKIYELTHSETEVRKRELQKQVDEWTKIYGANGDIMAVIKKFYQLQLAEIKKGEGEAKKVGEGDKEDKKKKPKRYLSGMEASLKKQGLWSEEKGMALPGLSFKEEQEAAIQTETPKAKPEIPQAKEAIKKGIKTKETGKEATTQLSSYLNENNTTLQTILTISKEGFDKVKEMQTDIETLKTQVANLTTGVS